MQTIPLQTDLRPALPNVYGTQDYHSFRETLVKIDEILVASDLERDLILRALDEYVKANHIDRACPN